MAKSIADNMLLASNEPELASNTFQGSMIDETGREIPITENMIQRACRLLDQELVREFKRQQNR